MNDERTRLMLGAASCAIGIVYYGIALWFYTKGYAQAGIEQAESHVQGAA